MVSILSHLLISSSIYYLLNFKSKHRLINYIFCMLFAILPDFDYVLYLVFPIGNGALWHRVYMHNVFVFLLLVFFVFLVNFRFNGAYFSTGNFAVYYGLHIFLDLFDNGVPLFFPLGESFFLIKQIGQYVGFPMKLIYEGNIYFSIFVMFLYVSSL